MRHRWSLAPVFVLSTACSSTPGGRPEDAAVPPVDASAPADTAAAATETHADAAPSAPMPDSGAIADALPPPADTTPASDTAVAAFTCNLVIGIKATGEWFNAGFESVVENARWEVIPVHNGHLELWADPKNALWALAPGSPCAQNAKAPERVIFVGTNYDYTTTEEFVPKLVAVVHNLQARFPGLQRIELQTYVRAPGNVACPGNLSVKTYIKPAQDESNQIVAAMFPGLVSVSPKFEVRACSDYSMPPHFTTAAAMAAAKTIGAHYLHD
jgi:hypothetical protein